MRVQFVHRYVLETVLMLEEGNFPHPRCAQSDIWEEDHGRGTVIQVATEGTGGVRKVRKDVGGRISIKSSDESTWEGGGETTTMGHPGRRKGPPGMPDVLPGKGVTADMPHGGVPGESVDKDGNAGAIRAQVCT